MEKKREPLRCRSVAEDDSMSWREVAGLNEITDVGCYIVQLKHGTGNDELPLPDCDQEHYIVGTLIVTESGTEKLQKNRVFGQTLILSQCNDGQTGIYYRTLAPVDGEQVWSEWNSLLSTGQFNEIADGSTKITLDVKDNSITAQKLSADVRTKVDNPLRPLYIAAGAEYNDSGADKTKTAPWGEAVTHKSGHYYLNGLGDITEEQMMDIYNEKEALNSTHKLRGNQMFKSRSFIVPIPYGFTNISKQYFQEQPLQFTWAECANLEVLKFAHIIQLNTINQAHMPKPLLSMRYAFYKCKKLAFVCSPIDISGINTIEDNTFQECASLCELRFWGLKTNLPLGDSLVISKGSIIYIIQNAAPSTAIIINLHPDAYTRLADDADVVAALEAQPLVSLVSA